MLFALYDLVFEFAFRHVQPCERLLLNSEIMMAVAMAAFRLSGLSPRLKRGMEMGLRMYRRICGLMPCDSLPMIRIASAGKALE